VSCVSPLSALHYTWCRSSKKTVGLFHEVITVVVNSLALWWKSHTETVFKNKLLFNFQHAVFPRRQESWATANMTARCALYTPWKFSMVPEYVHGYFCRNFNGLLFRWILWMCDQNLKFVALPIPEAIGGTQKIWAVPGYAHAPFSPKFLMGFCLDGPYECIGQICSP